MALAPPPHGSRLQELGDRLLVRFRPRRSGVVFLGIWLTGWTFGGLSAVPAFVNADTGSRAFLLLWLSGWALGECGVAVILAWKLFGREELTVAPNVLELRRQVGVFWITRRLDAGLVDGDFVAALMPTGEDEELRTDYRLELSYTGSTICIGEGMSESEAEEIASIVGERFRPRSWRNDDRGTRPTDMAPRPAARPTRSEMKTVASSMEASTPLRVAGSLVGAVVCAGFVLGVAAILYWPHHEAPRHARSSPVENAALSEAAQFPFARNFSDPRAYAAAVTRFLVALGHRTLLTPPRCSDHLTWTHWACSVMARATVPPFAGRTLRYQCHTVSTVLQDGRTATSGPLCGPVGVALPHSGPQPPAAKAFSNPRAYAEAMTRYSLRSGLTTVLSQPRCGDHLTWTHWDCSAMGRSTTPPDAGRTLRYQCHLTAVQMQDGRPTTSSTTCGPEVGG
jgi:hypothetical protein